MNITVDTNVLVRAVLRDDERQANAAARVLQKASSIVVTIPVLCEFVWVLRKVYALPPEDIATAIRALLDTANLRVDRPVAEVGLAVLEAGGDFADGAIVQEGERLGGEQFVSFDRKAVGLLRRQGRSATLLPG